VRFLIDECLSVDLVTTARGIRPRSPTRRACRPRGLEGLECRRYARDGDFILVTNNASDFKQLYAAQPLHAGLIILIPVVSRDAQRRLFKAAFDELAVVGEPVGPRVRIRLPPAASHVAAALDADRRKAPRSRAAMRS
jgi:hypothetical protein